MGTDMEPDFRLLEIIERVTPQLLAEKGKSKDICANVDLYSGCVYRMLGVPDEMLTPLFACARMTGWAAHRFEEIVSGKRIIRPAYKKTGAVREYVPMSERDPQQLGAECLQQNAREAIEQHAAPVFGHEYGD